MKEKSGEIASGRYAHCVIEWIRDWPARNKQEILAESLVLNRGSFFKLK